MTPDSPNDMPPPPQPPRRGLRDRPVRLAGLVLAGSTPITGILSYAIVSIVIGESRLEGPDGLTAAGVAALAMPLLVGALLMLWSLVDRRAPTRRTVAVLTAAIASFLLGVGLWSTLSADRDASIGGGLLVVASLPLGATALLLFRAQLARR